MPEDGNVPEWVAELAVITGMSVEALLALSPRALANLEMQEWELSQRSYQHLQAEIAENDKLDEWIESEEQRLGTKLF